MAEERFRYSITFKDQRFAVSAVAEILQIDETMFKTGKDALISSADSGKSGNVNYFKHIGVAFAWLTEAEANVLRKHGQVLQVERSFRVKGGGVLIPREELSRHFSGGGGPEIPWNIALVKANEAWAHSTGRGVKVAVLDTGINRNHPALDVEAGISFVPEVSDFDDDNGHGSNCAGVIAAKSLPGGVVGVAPDSRLFAVKILDSTNSGEYEWILQGLTWALEQSMDVVSMSIWHEDDNIGPNDPPDEGIQRAADALTAAGCFVVGIVGNSGTRPNHWVTQPGRCPAILAVGGVLENKSWWSVIAGGRGSSYGPTQLPLEQAVELVAPADPIRSTWLGNGYESYRGTSQACPHVAGAAALLKELTPAISPSQIRARLESTAEDLAPPGRDDKLGMGLLDCLSAVST